MSFDLAGVRAALPGREIDYYDVLPSTMTAAEERAPGAVVIAGEQTAGVGRHGHAWHSEPGAGLYFSLVLVLRPLLTLALGVAVSDGIEQATSIRCDLRWPNDVMLQERKLAGILVQAHEGRAIVGIGLNTGHRSMPRELAPLATSLALETGLEFRREDLLVAILREVDRWRQRPEEEILSAFAERSSYVRGKRVQVGEIVGTTAGLTPEGFLQVLTDRGHREIVVAGGVRPI